MQEPDSALQYQKNENAKLRKELLSLRALIAQDGAGLSKERAHENIEEVRKVARLCEAMGHSLDLYKTIGQVAKVLLEVFSCDRAWLLPPSTATWCVPIEACRDGWPCHIQPGEAPPASKGSSTILSETLNAEGPSSKMRTEIQAIEPGLILRHRVQSQMLVRLNPQFGAPWVLGLHQCSHDRAWSNEDKELFSNLAERISSVLNNLLVHRDLEEREERMQLALESVKDGVWDWHVQTGAVLVSRTWCSMLGLDEGQNRSDLESWKKRVHPEDLPQVMDALEQHLAGKKDHYSAKYRILTQAGQWLWILDRGRVVERDHLAKPKRLTGTIKDIQSEKHAEELLLRERRLFTGGPCVVFRWVAEAGWPVEYVSPNVIDFLGHTAEDFVSGRVPYSTIIHPDDLDRVAEEVAAHDREGAVNFEQDYRVLRASGEVRWLYDFTVINRDETGKTTHFEGYVLDATERKLAEADRLSLEAQVQHAQKLESLGVLAGGIAHDFNNLLMGVLGHADLAMGVLPVTSPAVKNVRGIMDAAKQAAELTHQMLSYSGKGRFLVECIDINEVIEEMTRLLEVTLSKTAILRFDLAPNLPPVEADGSQLRQVVMNLITNAAEAVGDRSGVVSVNTGAMFCDQSYLSSALLNQDLQEGTYVWFEVADTGEGMDTKTLEKIFDPFFTTKFTGRGLGLAAVQGIVQGHSGAIRVYSEPNRGTTFKVLLPASSQPTTPKEKGTTLGKWHGSGTALLVDDEETVRTISKLSLQALGFEVLLASDGPEALEVFKQRKQDIRFVLLDLTMPRMNGDEVFRELRRIQPDVRVILSSGYNQADIVQRFAGKGLAGFIQKPYGRKMLAKVLREVLSRPAPPAKQLGED